jgi:exonuclease III
MRIATYNVNGINGRLANLLGWLEEAVPTSSACRS